MGYFNPEGLPLLIGSLPLTDHREALELVFKYSYQIPLWVHLPKKQFEGMISQFMIGLPGYKIEKDRAKM